MGQTAEKAPGALNLHEEIPIEKLAVQNPGIQTAVVTKEQLGAMLPVAEPKPAEITYKDFTKIELRVGQVLEAEQVPKSEKLLKLKVDLGEAAPRQILAGIGKSYAAPALLVGKRFVFVTNLPPRKMMGLESNGMILAAGPDDSHLTLITPDADIANGSRFG